MMRDPREVRRRFRLLARLGQVHQRGRLPVPQVRRLLGHELGRPPGAHLPLDHGGGRRQHLGLRRADQLLQRHPQLQDDDLHRRQRRPRRIRSPMQHLLAGKEINRANMIVIDPRFTRTAAHATEYVRFRPGTDIPLIWGMLWHIFQNGWEDKEFIAPARLRHGRGPQGGREVDARGGRARHRRARRAAEARRREVRQGEARDPDLVHGRDAAHGRHRQRARLLHRAASPPAMSASRAPAPTSSAATPTCRARPISASISRPCRSTTA